MNSQKIVCGNIQTFTDVIAGLVQHGLTFEACATTLTIRCTGGY